MISIIILTYNEESNICTCLESIQNLTEEVFIVDSFSTDKTLEMAQEYTQKIFQNPWTHYAGQRQWALANLPFSYDWIFFLDADERLTPALRAEIKSVVQTETTTPTSGGYYVSRQFFFLGSHLRWGGCKDGLKELRLCNRRYLTISERAGHEVYISSRKVGYLKELMIHEDLKPLSAWIDRHNRYSTLNAYYLWSLKTGTANILNDIDNNVYDPRLFWKEKFRQKIWNRLPTGFRPALLFFYNLFFKLGFLDGLPGFIYIFFHDFWFPWLVDAKVLELRNQITNPIPNHEKN